MEREYSYKLKTLVEGQKLEIIYPSTDYEKVLIKTGDVHRPGLQLAGFYDYFDPMRVQLVGRMETAFLQKFTTEERQEKIDLYMSKKFPCLIICHDAEVMPEYIEAAKKHDVSLFSTSKNTSAMMSDIIRVIAVCPEIGRAHV